MSKKILLFCMIAVLLLSSLALSSTRMNDPDIARMAPGHKYPKLFSPEGEPPSFSTFVKPYIGGSVAMTFAPSRQLYDIETTQRERQHYTTMGRQISYAGYFNPACDYVYMDYSHGIQVGTSTITSVRYGVFDWAAGIWDFTVGGIAIVSPTGSSNTCNIETDPRSGYSVISYHHAADATSTFYTHVGTSSTCLGYDHLSYTDTLFGPPNLDNINTGYCGDDDPSTEPYAWPNISVDTLSDGRAITHAVSTKFGGCPEASEGTNYETKSLVYWRKEATAADQPYTGTWDGPYFIDSVYINTGVVVSDLNNDDVYVCYLKPMYYQTGESHPCSNNEQYLGYYQFTHEVVYRKSTDNGQSWGPIQYVTDYSSGYEINQTDPAWYDIDAMVDPNGNLHIVWGSRNVNEEDFCGGYYFVGKVWHWDSGNNCISLAYDASHPAYFSAATNVFGAWNIVISKYNISWCDSKLYIAFTRFGSHAIGDTAIDYGANGDFINADIYVVGSDAAGEMGKTWSDAINLTDTESDSCLPGDCFSEHWPSMAMYSVDSIMIEYIEDKDPGAFGTNDTSSTQQDNPIMFMTWPCFSMADVGSNACLTMSPTDPTYTEVALAPNGNTSGCNTEASFSAEVQLNNCGNVGLNYTASSNDDWLSVTSGAAGPISAGVGPRYSDNPAWSGAPGCATPATIEWTASSASLAEGNYSGTITVDIDDPGVDDFDITVNLVVTCEYYVPEYARITGGCWIVDLWNTPQAAHQTDATGNMLFYACGGDSITPLYHEALAVGWQEGGTIKMFSDAVTQDSGQLHMRALSAITESQVGNPSAGSGYYKTEGFWSTPDSSVQGKIEYFVPGHQDTSVLIEKVTLWNTSGAALGGFVVGEESDWDCDPDSSIDEGHIDLDYEMVYMTGDHNGTNIAAGLKPYSGTNSAYGARAINGYDYAYYTLGWYPDTLYNKLQSVSGAFSLFTDSVNGTEMRILNVFYGGTLGATDTLEICKVKAVSLTGQPGLQDLMDKGFAFIENYGLACQGRCGDANNDGSVNVSDAVWIINFAFVGGDPPQPIPACG
ncbi:MAG TPA: hypothetical protein ENO22_14080, partial [candidate division Zixibacteria bacterium]|nr:hypothetical protein [candidate division Zixibacteria bacterium]